MLEYVAVGVIAYVAIRVFSNIMEVMDRWRS